MPTSFESGQNCISGSLSFFMTPDLTPPVIFWLFNGFNSFLSDHVMNVYVKGSIYYGMFLPFLL